MTVSCASTESLFQIEDLTGLQIGLGHPDRLLDLPQVDTLSCDRLPVHDLGCDVGDAPLLTGRLVGPFDRRRVQSDVAPSDLDEPLLLQTLGPVGTRWAWAICASGVRRSRWARSHS